MAFSELSLAEFKQFCADAHAEQQHRTEVIRANTPADGPEFLAAKAKLISAGCQGRAREIKIRARDYLRRPSNLEVLYPGLECSSPAKLIAVGEVFLNTANDSRRIDMLAVKPINAKAVILVGRYRRRFDCALKTRVLLDEEERV